MKKIILLVIVIVIASGLYWLYQDSGELLSYDESHSEIQNWQTYTNETYSFEFKYPPDSLIEERGDLNYQHIRLQNYSTEEDRVSLLPLEYYLEISIYDHSMGHDLPALCENALVAPTEVKLGVVDGYRGYGYEGGDAGGVRFVVCAEYSDVDFYIQGTENDINAPLVNPILDSFKFF